MPAIPLGKGAYKRLDNPEIRLQNTMFEQDPANIEDQVSLIQRPGLSTWKTTNGSAIRGLAFANAGDGVGVFAVAGTELKGFSPSGGAFSVATNVIPGALNCTIASLGIGLGVSFSFLLIITNETGVYQYVAGAVSAVSFPDSAGGTSVDVIGSRFVVTRAASQRFYWSALNAATFDALDYASAENKSDNLDCLKVVGDELWLMGKSTNEPWIETGDADIPFQRVSGRTFQMGSANRATVCALDGMMFFVGGIDRRAFMIAPNPTPISDPGVEEKLRAAAVADLNGFCYLQGGHAVYVLNMGAQGSMAFDVSTGQWHEWSSYGDTSFRGRYSAPFGDGRTIVGDTSGRFNFLDPGAYEDNGDPIVQLWTGVVSASERVRCDNVILGATVGYALTYPDNPKVGLRFSDDRGRTWSDFEYVSMGHRGEFETQIAWKRLGALRRPGRVFQWRCAENLPLTVRTAKMNERI